MKQLSNGLLALLLAATAPPAAAQPDKGKATVWRAPEPSVVYPAENTAKDAWEAYKARNPKPSIDQALSDPILKGAIDLHAHFGPDAYGRQWDAFEIARLAQQRGMRGAVFKNHWSESAGLAFLIRKYAAPGFEAFGGLALNATVGGINPQAVRYFAEVEGGYARIVWMPTHDAESEVKYTKETRPFVRVSKNGVLLPDVLQVLDLIAEYHLVLATGHVSTKEMLAIVKQARMRGVDRIIITHPDLGPQYTSASIADLKQVVAQGAYVEVVASVLYRPEHDNFIEIIRSIGPEHCVVSTDSGLVGSANHADALVLAARELRRAGFSETDLNLMFKRNPALLLGLPVLSDE